MLFSHTQDVFLLHMSVLYGGHVENYENAIFLLSTDGAKPLVGCGAPNVCKRSAQYSNGGIINDGPYHAEMLVSYKSHINKNVWAIPEL